MTFKVKDYYFKKAKKENFLARSIYKLEEIDSKYKIINKGNVVIDLGYHPGSWIQYTSKKIGESGFVVGIDIKEINTKLSDLKNIKLFKSDIFDIKDISDLELETKADVLLSDMAPNTTGIKSVDQAKSLALVEQIFAILPIMLKPNGNLVLKVFESQFAQDFLKNQKSNFKEFNFLRPKSTRSVSKEYFVIAKGYLVKK